MVGMDNEKTLFSKNRERWKLTQVDDEDCDAIIDNTNMTINESCNAFLDILVDLGATQKIRTFNNRKGMTTVK